MTDYLHFREKSWVGRLSAKTGRVLSEWRGQVVMLRDTRMHTRGSGAGELGGRSPRGVEWGGSAPGEHVYFKRGHLPLGSFQGSPHL